MKSSKEVEPSARSSPCASPPNPCSRKLRRRAFTSQKSFRAATLAFCHPERSEGSLHFLRSMRGFFAPLRMTSVGKKLEYPAHRVETFAKAERKTKTEQGGLF